jgi:hypothetical protein
LRISRVPAVTGVFFLCATAFGSVWPANGKNVFRVKHKEPSIYWPMMNLNGYVHLATVCGAYLEEVEEVTWLKEPPEIICCGL